MNLFIYFNFIIFSHLIIVKVIECDYINKQYRMADSHLKIEVYTCMHTYIQWCIFHVTFLEELIMYYFHNEWPCKPDRRRR